jgi:hypothetical protein
MPDNPFKCEDCGAIFDEPMYQQMSYGTREEFELEDCCPCCGSFEIYEMEEDIYENGSDDCEE